MQDQSLNIDSILENFHKLQRKYDQVLVEGIGGLLVPLKADYLVLDLIKEMQLPLIIVSRFSLGTLNHTLLTLKAAQVATIEIAGIILNHSENRPLNEVELGQKALIEELSGVPVIGQCPFISSISTEQFNNKFVEEIECWKLFDKLT